MTIGSTINDLLSGVAMCPIEDCDPEDFEALGDAHATLIDLTYRVGGRLRELHAELRPPHLRGV